jgi:hypothetical protein
MKNFSKLFLVVFSLVAMFYAQNVSAEWVELSWTWKNSDSTADSIEEFIIYAGVIDKNPANMEEFERVKFTQDMNFGNNTEPLPYVIHKNFNLPYIPKFKDSKLHFCSEYKICQYLAIRTVSKHGLVSPMKFFKFEDQDCVMVTNPDPVAPTPIQTKIKLIE